ncbi:MAG: metal-sensitive transcriptional regulator [Anaerolineales bacterium]
MIESEEVAVREDILARLRRVEGQIRGIQRMIQEDRDCEAVATQLLAARAALDKASVFIMSHHIEQCLLDSAGHADPEQLKRVVSFFVRFAESPTSDVAVEEV